MLNCVFLQVLRWSALGAGVFYGFYHQRSISSATKAAAAHREFEHKQKLIEQAKAEYAKKNLPASQKTGGGDSTWNSLNFNFCHISTYQYLQFNEGLYLFSTAAKLLNTKLLTFETVIRDPMDKNFDLEAYLKVLAAEN